MPKEEDLLEKFEKKYEPKDSKKQTPKPNQRYNPDAVFLLKKKTQYITYPHSP